MIYRYTDSANSPVSLIPLPSVADDFYGNTFTVVSSDVLNLGYFASAASAFSAIYDLLIDSGGTVVPAEGHWIDLNLPGGYVLIANITGLQVSQFVLSGSLGTDMTLSQINDSSFVSIGQVSALPEAPFNLPILGTSRISSWIGHNPSVLSTYFHVLYNTNFYSASGGYVVIVNPYLTGNSDQAGTNAIDLNCKFFANSAVIYSLQGTLSYIDGSWSQDDISTDDQYFVTVDPESGTTIITTPDGDVVDSLKYGGSNDTLGEDLSTSIRNFTSWLKGTLRSIGDALDAGKNAITTLVGYASGFFAVIRSIYAWLPSPVYAVLTSAIVLVITIGIIKVFI